MNQSYAIGTWYAWQLLDHGITGDGAYTFILKHEETGSDAWFDSRETSTGPELEITYTVAAQYRDPDDPVNTISGLNYEYFSGTWNNLPDFNALTPDATGTATTFDIF